MPAEQSGEAQPSMGRTRKFLNGLLLKPAILQDRRLGLTFIKGPHLTVSVFLQLPHGDNAVLGRTFFKSVGMQSSRCSGYTVNSLLGIYLP